MTVLEKEVESYLVRQVEDRGGQCLKWTSPGTAGLPDRIVLLPGGRIFFVELKRPKGSRVGALQTYWKRVLQRLGFRHYIAYTKDSIDLMMAQEVDDRAPKH